MATLNGVQLKAGLQVEVYSKSREKWSLGLIKVVGYSPQYKSRMYQVTYGEWQKVLLEREVHLQLRLPKKNQKSDAEDEEKKLQNHSTQIANDLPLKKENVYQSLRKLLKEARNIDIHGM